MIPRRSESSLEVVGGMSPDTRAGIGEGGSGEVSLAEYVDAVVRGRWIVASAAAVALVLGGAYALLTAPVFRSDALLQVENKKGGIGGLAELSDMFGESSPAETEIEILRSRALVGAVVDQLRLDIISRPRRFPIVGSAIARRYEGSEPAEPLFGLRGFAWGGERLSVSRLSIPPALQSERLTLVVGEGGAYSLLDPGGALLLEGRVGATTLERGVEIQVSDLAARPGTKFWVRQLPREFVIEELQENLRITEKGKKTGILRLALEGSEPERIASILDALARAYLRQNVERKSAEAQKTLEFLETQLPALRTNLEAAERELESYRSDLGSVDVTLETQAAVQRVAEIERAASELQIEYAALRQRFTEEHPAVRAVQEKLARLGTERRVLDDRLKKLPAAELESVKRLRDVKVANELYLTLLNKSQELKVVREGTIGNVRILDSALLPVRPVAPRMGVTLLVAITLGLGLGVFIALLAYALDHGVDDPEQVERATGVGVHASVPQSPAQAEASRRAVREHTRIPLLADTDPNGTAVESLRSLRTSLQFALLEAPNSVVAVTGPAPGVGKSFVSANLAHLIAEGGKRVILIDGDLRRGHLHDYFGVDRVNGLSDAIVGRIPLSAAIRETMVPNLAFVSTGTIPTNPAELLASERFKGMLAELRTQYDVVLIDTPPVLAVTDAVIVARDAGVRLLVIRAGKHPVREIVAAVRQLARGGIKLQGIVMNGVELQRGVRRAGAYHYQYDYK